MARNIPMSFFVTEALVIGMIGKPRGAHKVKLGQILGQVYAINERMGRLKDGTVKESIVITGDFEAAREPNEDGEIATTRAGTVYLPEYYAKELRSALELSGGTGLIFAVDVFAVSTGQTSIPYVFEVESLMDRPASSPVEAMKRALLNAGKLSPALPQPARLQAPGRLSQAAHDAAQSLGTHDPIYDDVATDDDDAEPAPVAKTRKRA